eukprot:30542-Pelagococcus_subviridis.AAC.3
MHTPTNTPSRRAALHARADGRERRRARATARNRPSPRVSSISTATAREGSERASDTRVPDPRARRKLNGQRTIPARTPRGSSPPPTPRRASWSPRPR